MRKRTFGFVFILVAGFVFNQAKSQDLGAQEFVWCGIDFSMAKCIGSEGFTDPDAVKNNFFSSWNSLILNESDKYNLKETYQKTTQINDLSVVKRRNELPEVDDLVINDSYSFEASTIEKIVSDYNLEDNKSGLGLVYIVETLNKTESHAKIHTVFFDIATKRIIWQKEFTAKPGGFGFRNYWARSFYEVLKDSEKVFKKALKEN